MHKIKLMKLSKRLLLCLGAPLLLLLVCPIAYGQTSIPLQNLENFRDPGKSWSIAGDVTADLEGNTLVASKGVGILVNNPNEENSGKDLYTLEEYGDMDLDIEYMMAPGSNSGIYLLGRYEIQLLDSWEKLIQVQETTVEFTNAGMIANLRVKKVIRGMPPDKT